jgi:hypothetical protein
MVAEPVRVARPVVAPAASRTAAPGPKGMRSTAAPGLALTTTECQPPVCAPCVFGYNLSSLNQEV